MGLNWAGGDEHAERHGITHRSPQASRARKCPGGCVRRHGCRQSTEPNQTQRIATPVGFRPRLATSHTTPTTPTPGLHRPTQASRARKCPGAPAWMPTRSKNRIRRKQSPHPWASAHGSPRHTPHPPQAPPQAHTGEPGTEVPGCPGMDADTQKQNQTQRHATPVGLRPRLATSHTTRNPGCSHNTTHRHTRAIPRTRHITRISHIPREFPVPAIALPTPTTPQ
jgi:hypothetical protein